MVERGLSWEKAFEIYKQNVKVEDENSENNLPADGFYVYNQVILKELKTIKKFFSKICIMLKD